MKKIALTLALAVVSATCAMAQISVGAGYLNETSTLSYKSGNTTTTTETPMGGFYIGGDYEYGIGQGLSFSAGLKGVFYSNKDVKALLFEAGNVTTKRTELNLVVPVAVNYSYVISPELKAFAFAGPSFSFGLSAKSTTTYDKTPDNSSTTNLYGEDSNYNGFNLFLGAGVGVDVMDMVRVKFGYDLGLVNRSSAENTTVKDKQWYIGVAYLF